MPVIFPLKKTSELSKVLLIHFFEFNSFRTFEIEKFVVISFYCLKGDGQRHGSTFRKIDSSSDQIENNSKERK